MGSNASCQPARSEKLTEGIEPLNDSVYELHTPPQGVQPTVVIILFHGLPQGNDYKEAYWKTWKSRDDSVVWPKEWLPERLSNPWILSVSYDSYACKHDGAIDSYAIAETLIRDIILDDAGVGQDCPVVLVGHSLGGIVIKEFLLACLNRRGSLFNNETAKPRIELIDKFLDNCKGVFYYSTPHNGSDFIDYFDQKRVPLNAPLMQLMEILSSQTARINADFANARLGEGIKTQAMVENLNTVYMGFEGRIVTEASARHDIDPFNFCTAPGANHFDVCKAQNKKSCGIFKYLLKFIDTAMKDTDTAMKEKGRGLRNLAFRVPEDYVPTGNRASTSQPARRKEPVEINPLPMQIDQPTEGKPLNNSVYELYAPQSVPRVQVIFFHGLPQEGDSKEAYWKTWKSRDGTVVWPKEWLPEHLPSPQILSVSYDSYAREHDGATGSYIIAENLIQDIILGRARLGQDCPVVLVGHSLGGLIIKEFLLACYTKRGQLQNSGRARSKIQPIERFLANCKGVFYYSTPHNGSEFVDHLAGNGVPLNNPLMKLLRTLSLVTARINAAFAEARLGEDISTEAIGETLDTEYMGFKGRIVEEASARYDIDSLGFFTASYANHFEVCQATNNESCNIFTKLRDFITTAIEDKGAGVGMKILFGVPNQVSTNQVYKK